MNKWISELKNHINDEKVINYYEKEVQLLGTDNYDEICKLMGNPKRVAKEEDRQNDHKSWKVALESKNWKWTLFVLVPLALISIYTFIYTFVFAYIDFKEIKNMIITGKNIHILTSIFSTLAILLSAAISFLSYKFMKKTIYKLNDSKYDIRKWLIALTSILLVATIAVSAVYGKTIVKYSKTSDIMLKYKKHKRDYMENRHDRDDDDYDDDNKDNQKNTEKK